MTLYPVGDEARALRVAVVGSGPSAFYAVEALFQVGGLRVRVDMIDRLPAPYGLVRGGVAPDHQKIKTVVRVYEKVAAHPGFRFFGNVRLGRDVQVDDLTMRYDQLVYAVGNESDRRMGIPGEDLAGVHSATSFVGWYNGHPDHRDRLFDLAAATRVAVVGNGNVAMDVTRILVKDPAELVETDIAAPALEALRHSRVREVVLLGRRGPAQAAFSPKEIAEIGDLRGVDLVVAAEDAALDEASRRWLEQGAPRSAQKNAHYLEERSRRGEGSAARKVRCRFFLSPVEAVGQDGRVRALRLERNALVAAEDGEPRARGTGEVETLEVQLVLAAIGYRGVPIPGVPFDERAGIIPNAGGRVLDPRTGAAVPGQYVVGWAKRGPTGLIGTNSPDSKATVEVMIEDLRGARAPALPADDAESLPRLLRARGVDFVSYEDWQRLDRHEVERGQPVGKVREKLTSVEDMMRAVRDLRRR